MIYITRNENETCIKTLGNLWLNTKLLLNIKFISRAHICERWACERFHPSDGAVHPS